MAPSSDYSPLLAAEHSDHAAGPHEHVFPPPERATKRSQRRLPRQRPPLWIPDPFSFRSVGSTSPTPDRDGASTDSDSDSGEDTVYGSESEETGSEEKRQAGSAPVKNESASTTDEEDGWEFSLAALQKDRTKVRAPVTPPACEPA